MDPVPVVQADMKRVKLALTSHKATKLAHCELAVVRDLPWRQSPGPSSRHRQGEIDIISRYHACLELYVGSDRVSDEGT